VKSAYPIIETIQRLKSDIADKKLMFFMEIDQSKLAAKAGVPQECIVYTLGTSMANFVALTALVHAGDEVLIERPTYDPLLAILDHIGARVTRFERPAEQGFQLDLAELERKITPATRLVTLCNLHNPSSTFTDEATMRQVGAIAAKVGARVLVDDGDEQVGIEQVLEEARGAPVVAVFWVASDDHDFAEVRSASVFGEAIIAIVYLPILALIGMGAWWADRQAAD
jgi:hypothetical protein